MTHEDTPRMKTRSLAYFAVTALVAEPPRLLLMVTFCGFTAQVNVPLYLPPPLFVSVPISPSVLVVHAVPVTHTFSVALLLVLVASTRSCFVDVVYSALPTDTVSAACTLTVNAADLLTDRKSVV